MKINFIFFVFFLCINAPIFSQQDLVIVKTDSSSVIISDTLSLTAKKPLLNPAADLSIPKKALFRSLLIPGWGQIYNKRIWKVPVVYAALGGMTAVALFNRKNYLTFADYYRKAIDKVPHPPYDNVNAQTLRDRRDYWRQNMELAWIGVGAVYLLQGLEAYVNAHLKTFDVTDDIGLRIQPIAPATLVGLSPGIGLKITF